MVLSWKLWGKGSEKGGGGLPSIPPGKKGSRKGEKEGLQFQTGDNRRASTRKVIFGSPTRRGMNQGAPEDLGRTEGGKPRGREYLL